jgi:CheY-like chemotaxis protein
VLLIEDNEDARQMLQMVLELAGHTVYDAANGLRGLELLGLKRPDVAIIDINLPEMNGYQVAKRIREEPHGRGMLLLALTGYGGTAYGKDSSDDGFDHHLVKPVDLNQLARLLSESAEGPQLETHP